MKKLYRSSSFGRKLQIRSYSVEISKETLLKPQNEMPHFQVLEGSQIWMTFYFNFFHSVEKEKIVSSMFFRPKIIHSYVLGWNFKQNLVETPNEMPHFHVFEGSQIWMTFYFDFFHSVDNEIVVEVSSSIGRKLYIRTYSVEI
jgi:hypothetical protein